jgi:hypothetical protein
VHRVDLYARPGCLFEPDTGRLYEYDGAEVTVFFPWPEMVAFRRQVLDEAWKSLLPNLRVPANGDEGAERDTGEDAAARRRYWEQVPANVRLVVQPYAEGHWKLLAWMARTGDAAQDLVVSNPSLAFALACYREFRARRGRPVEAYAPPLLVYEKQRRILGWLGFPSSEAVRHILQKVEHPAINAQRLLALRPRLADAGVRQRLAHLPRIGKSVLRMAADGSVLAVTPRMLQDIQAGQLDPPDRRALALLHDMVRMWQQVRPRAPLPLFHRFARIGEVHDQLAQEVNREATAAAPMQAAPAAPPLPETDAIVALTTRQQLVEEGEAQHNCVASYFGSVALGYRAIYRVLKPERATLSLVRRRAGWRIEQLKGPYNRSVRPETRRAVSLWLADRM